MRELIEWVLIVPTERQLQKIAVGNSCEIWQRIGPMERANGGPNPMLCRSSWSVFPLSGTDLVFILPV